jgi:hypothetical protein
MLNIYQTKTEYSHGLGTNKPDLVNVYNPIENTIGRATKSGSNNIYQQKKANDRFNYIKDKDVIKY